MESLEGGPKPKSKPKRMETHEIFQVVSPLKSNFSGGRRGAKATERTPTQNGLFESYMLQNVASCCKQKLLGSKHSFKSAQVPKHV